MTLANVTQNPNGIFFACLIKSKDNFIVKSVSPDLNRILNFSLNDAFDTVFLPVLLPHEIEHVKNCFNDLLNGIRIYDFVSLDDEVIFFDYLKFKLSSTKEIESNLFRIASDSLSDYVLITDPAGNIFYESSNASQVLGFPEYYLLNKNLMDFLLPEDIPSIKRKLAKFLNKSSGFEIIIHKIKGANGKNMLLKTTAINKLNDPVIKGIVIISQDISEAFKYKAKLLEEQRTLKLFFNNSIFGAFFMMFDKPVFWQSSQNKDQIIEYALHHLRITKVNKAFLQQYDANEKDLIGATPFDFFEHDLDQERKLLFDIFENEQFVATSFEQTSKGENVVFEGNYEVLKNHLGAITGVFGIQKDVTERFNYMNKLKKQNETLSEVAWMQSHLYRNPIANILGALELTKLGNPNETEIKEILNLIEKSAYDLDQIVRDINAKIRN
jgi:PAS domain S-box-containing protein